MKFLFIFISLFFNTGTEWLTDFGQAKKEAAEKHQYILIYFSGSDWCGPCMRFRKEIFEADDFKTYAGGHLVLLNADFPRNKKNKLTQEQETKNDLLADKYNPDGKFPLTLLLTADGRVVKAWEGFPESTAGEFVNRINLAVERGK